MNQAVDISVIIPSYNRWYCLPRALDSVFAQTQPAHEVIVIDDGSTDNTVELLSEHYPDVKVISQANAGVSAARNTGISSAKGQWIALLDSDDVWHPTKLERQVTALTEAPEHRLCHCDELWIRNGVRVNPKNKHRKTGGWIFEHCLPLCAISPSAALIRKDVFTDVGLFDETLPACEDYDYWLRLTHGEPVLYLDDALLSKYGGHEDQLSRAHWGMDRFRIQVLFKLLKSAQLSQQQRAAAMDVLKLKIKVYAAGATKRGRTEEAEQLITTFADIELAEQQL